MLIKDGFPGQRLQVLARPLVDSALNDPITDRMLVTDAGYFPHAAAHGRARRGGASQAIVMICVEGAGRLSMDDRVFLVQSGNAVVIPSNTPHLYVADEANPWSIWWLHVAGTDVDELVNAIIGPERDPVLPLRNVYAAAGLVEQIVGMLENDETSATLYDAAGSAWRLLAQLCSDRLRGGPAASDRIHVVEEYLRSNLAAAFTIAELAHLVGLSASHFSALFKASTGLNATEYVKRLRSARARQLLMTTAFSIAEVGARVGYPDAFYFSRQFRSVNGISPSEFRLRALRDAI